MERKFHLVNGEPKPCNANIRDCPVGGEHFTNAAEARENYEAKNKSQLFAPVKKKRTLASDINHIKNKLHNSDPRKVGAITATTVAITGGLISTAMPHNSIENQANKTPYSVSVSVYDNSAQPYYGYVVDTNLKHSSFSECAPRQDNPKYISCTTDDGKFTITSKPRIEAMKTKINNVAMPSQYQTLEDIQVKDNSRNKVVRDTHVKKDTNSNIYIPAINTSK